MQGKSDVIFVLVVKITNVEQIFHLLKGCRSSTMKKSHWKLVVNRCNKMTFEQVKLLTNWQLICRRSKFLMRWSKASLCHLCLVASLILSDSPLDCHQYPQVLELAKSLQFYKQCGIVKKVHIGFS